MREANILFGARPGQAIALSGAVCIAIWLLVSWAGAFLRPDAREGIFLVVPLGLCAWLAFLLVRTRRALSCEVARRIAAERGAFIARRRDDLTGLPNRLGFREAVASALERARCGGQACSVLFLDMDGFKPVNDRHGHAAGDRLLVEVADRLRSLPSPNAPEREDVARLGGDEFGLLIEHKPDEDIRPAAEAVLAAIDRAFRIGGEQVQLGASIGVVTVGPDEGGAEDLIHLADLAMYEAKRSGLLRNRVVLREPKAARPRLRGERGESSGAVPGPVRGPFVNSRSGRSGVVAH